MQYFFTYGSEGQPFVGGWSVVVADSMDEACELFRERHPDREQGLLNCAGIYDEVAFFNTMMGRRGSNLGAACHERITR